MATPSVFEGLNRFRRISSVMMIGLVAIWNAPLVAEASRFISSGELEANAGTPDSKSSNETPSSTTGFPKDSAGSFTLEVSGGSIGWRFESALPAAAVSTKRSVAIRRIFTETDLFAVRSPGRVDHFLTLGSDSAPRRFSLELGPEVVSAVPTEDGGVRLGLSGSNGVVLAHPWLIDSSGRVVPGVAHWVVESSNPRRFHVLLDLRDNSGALGPRILQFSISGAVPFLSRIRTGAGIALLDSDSFLATGGVDDAQVTSRVELRRSSDETMIGAATRLLEARSLHAALATSSGSVIVSGGTNGSSPMSSVEIADLREGIGAAWKPAGNLMRARFGHEALPLPDGSILVVGGYDGRESVAEAELFDAANAASGTWRLADGFALASRLERAWVSSGGGDDSKWTSSSVAEPAHPMATIVVNTAADDNTVNGNCTLREAIQAANTNAAVDGCSAGSGADVITFSGALAGQTISLSISGDNTYGPSAFGITSPITIAGDAALGIILQRNGGAGRLRHFRVAAGASLTLQYVTLKDGLAQGGNAGNGQAGGGGGGGLGGAIVNEGSLTLTNVSILTSKAIGGNGGVVSATNTQGGGGGGGLGGDGGSANGTYNGGNGGGPNGGAGGGQNQAGGAGGFGGGAGGGGGQSPGGVGGAGGFGGGGGGGAYSNPGGLGGFAGGGGGSGTLFNTMGTRKPGGAFGGDGGNDHDYYGAGGGAGAGLGGAIFNSGGAVTVTATTFDQNETWGGNGGSATDASNTGGGGGAGSAAGTIFSLGGSVTVSTSTFSSNLVRGGVGGASNICFAGVDGGGGGHAYGGGIFGDAATLSITNSTFSANSAIGGQGGAGYTCGSYAGNGGDARGGAVTNRDGVATIKTSSFADNATTPGPVGSRGSGGGGADGVAKGGALYNWQSVGTATTDLSNSVFANSLGATDVENLAGTVSGSFNLIKTSTNVPAPVILTTAEPGLAPLTNNGGPTKTVKPGSLTSPIINSGNCVGGTITVDQRGIARPQGGACDLGAYETIPVATGVITVNTVADELNSNGNCSLREAIQAANFDIAVDACSSGSFDDVIKFAPALNGQTINLSTIANSTYGPSSLVIQSPITIQPDPGIAITVSRDVAVTSLRQFFVASSGKLTLSSITVSGGRAAGGNGGAGTSGGGGAAGIGGAIMNLGTLFVTNGTRLQNNLAIGGNGGGAVYVCCGSNLASGGGGGGLGADGGGGGGNSTAGAGGGPNGGAAGQYGLNGGPGGFGGGGGGAGGTNGSVNNSAGSGGWGAGGGGGSTSGYGALPGAFGGGGGGQSCCGTNNIDFFGGTGGYKGAYGFGGGGGGFGGGSAVFNLGGTVSIVNSTVSGNASTAGSGGGSISSSGNSGTPGSAGMAAGAIFNQGGAVTCSASTFSGNTAVGGNGGNAATSGYNGGYGNHARGAALFSNTGSVSLTNCTFTGNTATGGTGGNAGSSAGNGGYGQGGTIFTRDSAITVNNSTIANGTVIAGPKGAGSGGSNGGADTGGLYVWQDTGTSTASLSNNIFSGSVNGVEVTITAATATGSLNLIRSNANVPPGLILSTADPKFGALGSNGGLTQTIGFAPTSPARDTGNCSGGTISVDQRGLARPNGAACDLGAFEFDPATAPAPIAVNDTATVFQMSDNFETGNFSANPWTFSGNAAWTVSNQSVHGGSWAGRSGVIGNSANTVMQLVKTVPAGAISFWGRVSSESGYDFFRFYIDGNQQLAISGNGGWGQYSYAVGAGTHTFAWRYDKDGSATANSDAAFVDDILFTPTVPQALNEDSVYQGSAPGVLVNDSDPLGDAISVVAGVVSSTGGATVTLSADGSYSYDPRTAPLIQATKASQTYNDTFTYSITNTSNKTASATVSLAVAGINDVPVAAANAYGATSGAPLVVGAPGVLGNDADVDADPLTAVQNVAPAHGSLTLNANGSFTYTPTAGYAGADSFTYHANDGITDSGIVTVSFTVTAAPTPGRVSDSGASAMMVKKNGADSSKLDFNWGSSCGNDVVQYGLYQGIYQGTVGSWASHVPLQCSTSGTTANAVTPNAVTPGAVVVYFLVVPRSASAEGSYGNPSGGGEIAQSASPCIATQNLGSCP